MSFRRISIFCNGVKAILNKRHRPVAAFGAYGAIVTHMYIRRGSSGCGRLLNAISS